MLNNIKKAFWNNFSNFNLESNIRDKYSFNKENNLIIYSFKLFISICLISLLAIIILNNLLLKRCYLEASYYDYLYIAFILQALAKAAPNAKCY